MRKSLPYVGRYITKWLIMATILGIGGGVSATVLKKTIGIIADGSSSIPIYLAPIIGGIIVSVIYLLDSDAAGFGTDRYISQINLPEGQFKWNSISMKVFFSKIASTASTLGFSGSGGVEGPMLVIGGAFARITSKVPILKNYFTIKDMRTLVICGAAGALGAILHSPLGGGIFVVEILYRSSLHYDDLFPAMLSSTMGFLVYSIILNPHHSRTTFNIPSYTLESSDIIYFIIAAVLAGAFSILFMQVFGFFQRLILKAPRKRLHPVLGGFLTGIILFIIPEAGGIGSDTIQSMIDGSLPILFLLILLVGKILATSFTIGSGGSAGLVIPAIFIGAIAGNMGSLLIIDGDPLLGSAVVVSGMAAGLSGVANVPIAAAIMLVEMSGISDVVPAVIGSVIGYSIAHSKVIYGVIDPDESQFQEISDWKKQDIDEGGH